VSEQITEHVSEDDPVTLLPGAPHSSGHNSGRRISWVGTVIVIIGFIIGGIAFSSPPTWWLVHTGGGIALVGFIVGGFARMNEDWY